MFQRTSEVTSVFGVTKIRPVDKKYPLNLEWKQPLWQRGKCNFLNMVRQWCAISFSFHGPATSAGQTHGTRRLWKQTYPHGQGEQVQSKLMDKILDKRLATRVSEGRGCKKGGKRLRLQRGNGLEDRLMECDCMLKEEDSAAEGTVWAITCTRSYQTAGCIATFSSCSSPVPWVPSTLSCPADYAGFG